MLGEFTIYGFHVFWQRTIMETDSGILYYALFVWFVLIHVFSAVERSCTCIFSSRKIFSDVCMLEDFTFCAIRVFSAWETSGETCTDWTILHFVLFVYFQLT